MTEKSFVLKIKVLPDKGFTKEHFIKTRLESTPSYKIEIESK